MISISMGCVHSIAHEKLKYEGKINNPQSFRDYRATIPYFLSGPEALCPKGGIAAVPRMKRQPNLFPGGNQLAHSDRLLASPAPVPLRGTRGPGNLRPSECSANAEHGEPQNEGTSGDRRAGCGLHPIFWQRCPQR